MYLRLRLPIRLRYPIAVLHCKESRFIRQVITCTSLCRHRLLTDRRCRSWSTGAPASQDHRRGSLSDDRRGSHVSRARALHLFRPPSLLGGLMELGAELLDPRGALPNLLGVLSSSSMITDNNLLVGTEEDASSDTRAAWDFNGSMRALLLLLSLISIVDMVGL